MTDWIKSQSDGPLRRKTPRKQLQSPACRSQPAREMIRCSSVEQSHSNVVGLNGSGTRDNLIPVRTMNATPPWLTQPATSNVIRWNRPCSLEYLESMSTQPSDRRRVAVLMQCLVKAHDNLVVVDQSFHGLDFVAKWAHIQYTKVELRRITAVSVSSGEWYDKIVIPAFTTTVYRSDRLFCCWWRG